MKYIIYDNYIPLKSQALLGNTRTNLSIQICPGVAQACLWNLLYFVVERFIALVEAHRTLPKRDHALS